MKLKCDLLDMNALIGEVCPVKQNLDRDIYKCDKVVFVRLGKDVGFCETGNYGFCSINKNSIGALRACCEILCPLKKKVM